LFVLKKEEVPLGTAGPIGLARDNYFKDSKFDYLFVFNANITCSYPLKELLDYYITSQAEGTIYTISRSIYILCSSL
jgi:mannose-1-phosphate guanylyltransferase